MNWWKCLVLWYRCKKYGVCFHHGVLLTHFGDMIYGDWYCTLCSASYGARATAEAERAMSGVRDMKRAREDMVLDDLAKRDREIRKT